jgi:hypothetical protein
LSRLPFGERVVFISPQIDDTVNVLGRIARTLENVRNDNLGTDNCGSQLMVNDMGNSLKRLTDILEQRFLK